MAASNLLTSLANVKAWAGVTTSNEDALLIRLIGSVSRVILAYLQRPTLFKHAVADVFDGVGQRAQMLREYPVLAVNSVLIGGQTIPASSSYPNSGYIVDSWNGYPPARPQQLSLIGYCIGSRMPGGLSITYTAGFAVSGESHTIPGAPYAVAVNAPNGPWGQDDGVTFANGTALTLVAGTPAAGQYAVQGDMTQANYGQYTFAAADVGKAVLISYSYIPADIEEIACEMVGERYSYKSRIGYVSKTLAGQETVTFSQKGLPDYVQSALNPYKSVVLV